VMIEVLDKGFVRLVDHMGSDLSIVRAARVSYNADWRAGTEQGSDERLIAYLMKNRHTSPFEAVTFTFEVKAPIFIFRQWHRHRTWSYNEVSARYTELDEGFYVPKPQHIGIQSKDNKQVRVIDGSVSTDQQRAFWDIEEACDKAFATYKDLLARGVPRELARSVLPVAAYSRMFATVDLHNLMAFLRLRMHSHSQWEIQQYANALCDLAGSICPVAIREFRKSLEEEKR
jgi:thymidylate synthase (FAD)